MIVGGKSKHQALTMCLFKECGGTIATEDCAKEKEYKGLIKRWTQRLGLEREK